MKYIVCSDIHRDENAFERILEAQKELGCDRILCAGDFCPTANMEYMAGDMLCVEGNCDRWGNRWTILPDPKPYADFRDFGRRIVITHGDRYWSDSFSLAPGDIFISGHTHVPVLEKGEDGIIYFNPGSPSRPRGREGKTIGTLENGLIRLLSFPDLFVLEELSFEL